MEDEEKTKRYKNSVDTFSLLEGDGVTADDDLEREVIGEQTYLDIIKKLPTDREKFIALALDNGFNKVQIAYMLSLNPSTITRTNHKMQICLMSFHVGRKARF